MSLPERPTHTAYIALGSNLGDRVDRVREAIAELAQLGTVEAVSSFYETEPVGNVKQPDFVNAVVHVRTALLPQHLMTALLEIEQRHGRDRTLSPPQGPRTLDLDLLSYDDLILRTPMLTLPHPAIAKRAFVLVPLAEIAPRWRNPVDGKPVTKLLRELAQDSGSGPSTVRPMPKSVRSTQST